MGLTYMTKETKQVNYMQIPFFLFNYKLSMTSLIIYTFLLDRARYSLRMGYKKYNEDGKVFCVFTEKNIAEAIGRSESTVKRCLNQLKANGLIEISNDKHGRANKIFVLYPEVDPGCSRLGISGKTNLENMKTKVHSMEEEKLHNNETNNEVDNEAFDDEDLENEEMRPPELDDDDLPF